MRPSCVVVQPEMQAQTTLINFTVTRDGLEEQLLAAVVAKERPDLEKLKANLTHQQNEFKITLKSLEDSLLARLSTAEGNFLGDYDLVENLETTKRTAMEIEEKVAVSCYSHILAARRQASAVLSMTLCMCQSVSQVDIEQSGRIELVFGLEAFFDLLCFKEIRVSTKIRVLPSRTLS